VANNPRKQQIESLKSQMNQYLAQINAATAQRQQVEQQASIDHGADAIAVLTETRRLDQFNGQWINTDRKTGGIIQVEFRTESNRRLVHVFGNCTPSLRLGGGGCAIVRSYSFRES
jgi:hypothetical protein